MGNGEDNAPALDADHTATSPIDTPPSKPKPGKKGPKPGTFNWSTKSHPAEQWKRAEEMWAAGESVPAIAQATGIAEPSIYARASRYKWVTRKTLNTKSIIPKAVPAVVERHVEMAVANHVGKTLPTILPQVIHEKVQQHLSRTLQTVAKLQDRIDEHLTNVTEVEETKSLSSTLDMLDKIARRTYGLDQPGGAAASLGLLSRTAAPVCPIIEAEVISADTGA